MARGSFADYLDGHDTIVPSVPLVTMASFCGGASERQDETSSISDSYQIRAALYLRWQQAREKHRRDNYVLEDMMKYALGTYEHDLWGFADLQQNPEKPATFKRVRGCGSTLGSVTPAMLTADSGKVVQAGLAQCASVWACPVCSAKIQARRSFEIRAAIEWAREKGYKVQLLTLTARHDRSDRLVDLMPRMAGAFADMKRGRAYRRAAKAAGVVGMIRAVEMTHGTAHGWHVHYHIIVISAHGLDDAVVRASWVHQLGAHGFIDAEDTRAVTDATMHGMDLRDVGMDDASVAAVSEYVCKDNEKAWYIDGEEVRLDSTGEAAERRAIEGAAKELGLSNTKLGRKANRSPFQILRDMIVVDLKDDASFSRDMRLIIEYALATKGKKQLFWSRGLKAAVGIEEKSDEDVVDDEQESAKILWGLTRQHWTALRKSGYVNDYMKDVAQTQSLPAVQAFFDCMFPCAGLPRVLSATDTRRIWEAERQARMAAAARYRSGETVSIMTAEEKTAVFVDAHPWSNDAERERVATRKRAVADQLQKRRRAAGVPYQQQLTLALDES